MPEMGYVAPGLDMLSERRFRMLVEAIPQIVWTATADGSCDFVNRRWCDYSGMTVEESVGQGWLEAVHPDDREKATSTGAEIFDQESNKVFAEIEYRLRRADGVYRWFLVRAEAIRDDEGKVVGWLGICTDVDDLKNAETTTALHAYDQRIRKLADSNVMGVIFGNIHGGISYANDEYLRIIGYGREEFESHRIGWADITPPEWLHVDERAIALAKRSGGSATPYEKEYVRKDGSRISVIVGFTIFGEVETVAFILDVSRQKRIEGEVRRLNAELNASIQELRTVLDTVPVGIRITNDPSCKVMTANSALAEMLGIGPDDTQAFPVRVFKDGAEIPTDTLPLQRAAATGLPVGDELYEVLRADGKRLYICVRANPIKDSSGAVAVWVDITELKETEKTLQQADRRKDEFLATLSHELRNPLAAISNGLALLRKPNLTAESHNWAVEMIGRQLSNSVLLIDDLLDVSRISSGKILLKRERIDASSIVARAAESVCDFVQSRRHQMVVSVSPEPMPLDGDPIRLEQILTNLLINAAKYTENGGRIELDAGPAEKEVVFRVRDNGVGISPEMLPKVFDLFAQVDGSVARSDGGLGIGLSLVRTLTEMHGGSVSVASNEPGQGTEFTVRLPRSEAQA